MGTDRNIGVKDQEKKKMTKPMQDYESWLNFSRTGVMN